MTILFVMQHPGYARHYESTLRLLAQRGHRIYLAFDRKSDKFGEMGLLERLTRDHQSITFEWVPKRDDERWFVFSNYLRAFQDFLRYFDPRFQHAVKLRERARKRVPRVLLAVAKIVVLGRSLTVHPLRGLLKLIERATPASRRAKKFVRDRRPDLVLVTPLVDVGSNQVDYLKSAKQLGKRTALAVASWDNLTNKGLMRIVPDRVFVWNEMQRVEAVELHGARSNDVIVTGAQSYDHWFEWQPSRTREAFCLKVGLDPNTAFVLYLGSSNFIAPGEAEFGLEWAQRIRGSGEAVLAGAGILVRPHPKNADGWDKVAASRIGNLAVWPPRGANPVDPESKADYFDSLYYCSAVVGVNTSAQIEASIVGRPVLTMLHPRFVQGQTETLHFHYLVNVNGGLVRVARNWDEHVNQLAEAVATPGAAEGACRRFVEAFVRPKGRDVPATPILAGAIEALLAAPAPRPVLMPRRLLPLRFLVFPLAVLLWAGHQASKDKWGHRQWYGYLLWRTLVHLKLRPEAPIKKKKAKDVSVGAAGLAASVGKIKVKSNGAQLAKGPAGLAGKPANVDEKESKAKKKAEQVKLDRRSEAPANDGKPRMKLKELRALERAEAAKDAQQRPVFEGVKHEKAKLKELRAVQEGNLPKQGQASSPVEATPRPMKLKELKALFAAETAKDRPGQQRISPAAKVEKLKLKEKKTKQRPGEQGA